MSGFSEMVCARQESCREGIDPEEMRRKREHTAAHFRKQVREEALQKKRMTGDVPEVLGLDAATDTFIYRNAMGVLFLDVQTSAVDRIPCLHQMLMSEVPQAQFIAAEQFRKLVSIEPNPPIQEVIAAGVVPRFVLFLQEVSRPDLQYESAWVLTNIASGTTEQTRVVAEHGALPIFVQLLHSPNDEVREQAVWALGNVAGDSPSFRDLVLQSGGLTPIMTMLRETAKLLIMRSAMWTLSNLCRGKPPPPFRWVSPALGTLATLLTFEDDEVKTSALWALSYLSDGANYRITAVIQVGVCGTLVELLDLSSLSVQRPALRVVRNMVAGDDHQTQAILQHGALQALGKLLLHSNPGIRSDACVAISNIIAGNREQIQELIPPVVSLLQQNAKKEAMWVIGNATFGGSPQQVDCLVECCIQPMADLLEMYDAHVTCVTLEALENILEVGKQRQQEQGSLNNPYALLFEQADESKHIEALQAHESEEIYQTATRILETYFPEDLDDVDLVDDAASPMAFGGAVPTGLLSDNPPSPR